MDPLALGFWPLGHAQPTTGVAMTGMTLSQVNLAKQGVNGGYMILAVLCERWCRNLVGGGLVEGGKET